MAAGSAHLQQIKTDRIKKNPDNPRIIFREDEMNQLLESIRVGGIRVPLSLYQDGDHYVLIDGERRWRSAKRLNMPIVPAIVQPKPTKLENLLMMFNIHNVRVEWDPLPMALKLRDVQELLMKQGQPAGPKELSAITGVSLPGVRRAFDLLDLPMAYQKLLLTEAQKPRSEQRVKADLFIEVYKSLHAIERHAPEVLARVSKREYVDAMIKKYLSGVVNNVVRFRDISKIARAELAGASRAKAIPILVKLASQPTYSIDDAFSESVASAYDRRDLVTRATSLAERLQNLATGGVLDDELRRVLLVLRRVIERLVG